MASPTHVTLGALPSRLLEKYVRLTGNTERDALNYIITRWSEQDKTAKKLGCTAEALAADGGEVPAEEKSGPLAGVRQMRKRRSAGS